MDIAVKFLYSSNSQAWHTGLAQMNSECMDRLCASCAVSCFKPLHPLKCNYTKYDKISIFFSISWTGQGRSLSTYFMRQITKMESGHDRMELQHKPAAWLKQKKKQINVKIKCTGNRDALTHRQIKDRTTWRQAGSVTRPKHTRPLQSGSVQRVTEQYIKWKLTARL